MANSARDDLRAGLGPEFQNFDPADLNPRNFVRKHLLDDLEDDWNNQGKPKELEPAAATYTPEPVDELGFGEIPRTTRKRPDRPPQTRIGPAQSNLGAGPTWVRVSGAGRGPAACP
ncbi:hypothetical protein [Nonomuraea salmonea]|uniref:hypothetical protein n=1 Tax=Nonomuraea salmonea TaxID=46181 RepID=UPI0031EA6DCF